MIDANPREQFKYHAGVVEAKLPNRSREKDRIWTPVSFSPRSISVAPVDERRVSPSDGLADRR